MNKTKEAPFDLSIVIPAYNEGSRLHATLNEIENFVQKWGKSCEVLIVLDGCTDNTMLVIEGFLRSYHVATYHLLKQPNNLGKGAAIRLGIQAASGNIVGFTDADLPYGAADISKVFEMFMVDSSLDLVIGARDLPCSISENPASLARRLSGQIYSRLIEMVLRLGIPDTQCGFKFFRSHIADKLFSLATINGFGFDVEILCIAHKNNLEIKRIPVSLQNSNGSSVHIISDSLKMLLELFRIRRLRNSDRYTIGAKIDDIPGNYQEVALKNGPPAQRAWHEYRITRMRDALTGLHCHLAIDIGCGSWIAFPALKQLADLTIGIDLNFPALKFCHSHYSLKNGELIQANASKLPFKSSTCDLVIIQEVIEHLTIDQVKQCLLEAQRILKPGGHLYITTPNYHSLWPFVEFLLDLLRLTPRMRNHQHISKFTGSSLTSLLVEIGFSIEGIGSFNGIAPWLAILSKSLADEVAKVEMNLPYLPGSLLFCMTKSPITSTAQSSPSDAICQNRSKAAKTT